MKTFSSLILVGILVGGSIYLLLHKPAPEKYANIIVNNEVQSIDKPISLLFVGDIMLDRAIRKQIDSHGLDYLLEDVKTLFDNKDLVIGNLEGTITNNESVSVVNNKILHFTFATTSANDLKRIGFSGFSLANNHALDFYQTGYEETVYNLSNSNLFNFGHPLNNQNLSNKTQIKNKNVCFVGYHSLYNASTTNTINEIKNIKSLCDFLIVFAHWGVEYEKYENADQQNQSHEFIDNGADLVIGAHPHVIQPIEIYKGKAIFYSLGNFIFDQDFSLNTRQGIAVETFLNNKNVSYKVIPIEMFKGKLYFPDENNFIDKYNILTSKLSPDLKNSFLMNTSITLNR